MKLDEYLTGLHSCSDNELASEFGVIPLWVIYGLSNLSIVEQSFRTDKLKLTGKNDEELFFDYVPGTVDLKVTYGLSSYALTDSYNLTDKDREFYKRSLNQFNMSIILYPYQKNEMQNVSKGRAIANAIEDICNITLSRGIPIFLPMSIGSNYSKPKKDLSRIVQHTPKIVSYSPRNSSYSPKSALLH